MGCTGFPGMGICSNEFAYIVLACLVPHMFGFIEYNTLDQVRVPLDRVRFPLDHVRVPRDQV